MKILVTGAAGFIGSHLAERLAGMGHSVVGLDCFTPYYSKALKKLNARDVEGSGVKIMELDLAEDDLSDAVKGVDIIYHSAAQPGISAETPFETYVRNNIIATYKLLEAARNLASLKLFVNISTSSVYGAHARDSEETAPKPTSYYGVTKLAAEQLVLSYNRAWRLPAWSLRLFSVYGERERPEKLYPKLIRSILEDRAFPLFEGSENHRRSFTYISDAIDGFISVLANMDKANGEIFNIGSDIEITTGDGIKIIERIMGRKAKFVKAAKRPGDQLETHANIAKARKILGYNPKVTTGQGLEAEVKWYQQNIFGKVEY